MMKKNSRGQWAGPGIEFKHEPMVPPHLLLPSNFNGINSTRQEEIVQKLIEIFPWRAEAEERMKKSFLLNDVAWMIVQAGGEKSYVRQNDEKFMTEFFYSNLARVSLNRVDIVKADLEKILKDSRSWEIVAFHTDPSGAARDYQVAQWQKLIKREELYLEKEGIL